MHPRPEDLTVAKNLASRIVAAGQDRIKRVTLLGSRAKGIAQTSSDFDLMALVEIPRDAKPWTAADDIEERRRIRQRMGPLPVPVDLWIRTTDQYEEACGVIGGFEYLAETEGVVVFSVRPERVPVVRRTPDQVRRRNVCGWLDDAHVSIRKAGNLSHLPTLRDAAERDGRDSFYHARRCVQRTMTAILVYYQVPSTKQDTAGEYLTRIASVAPQMEQWLRSILASGGNITVPTAHAVLTEVVHWFTRDGAMRRYLAPLLQKLSRPVAFIAH